MKKVAIIGTTGLPANGGRFELLAGHMVKSLGKKYDFTVYGTSRIYATKDRKSTF